MTRGKVDLVSIALKNIRELPGWSLPQWESLVPQARSANLLARLAALLEDEELLRSVPKGPRAHLEAAQVVAKAQEEATRREVVHLRKALEPTGVEIILLKGAAYLFAGLPASRGRLYSDIDILVPRGELPEVEAALMLHGWATSHHDPYDQRYYREWMHELPPMQHVARQTVVDVHHSIVPVTARLKPDSKKLVAASQSVPGGQRLRTLAPCDMVLHSAAHLFLNEELSNGLRDLADLDSLLRYFGRQPGFWDELRARAREIDLERPLDYALRYSSRILGTLVPLQAKGATEFGRSPRWLLSTMDGLYLRALRPDHPYATDLLTPLARKALYVRAHWLRMPPLLLARHLTIKALRRERATSSER